MRTKTMLFTVLTVIPALLSQASFAAPSPIHYQTCFTTVGAVSKAYLESPIELLSGIGARAPSDLQIQSSLADPTLRAKALAYTAQGLALNYAFQWEDAIRSFYEALRLDPNLSRAYLGILSAMDNLNHQSIPAPIVADLISHARSSAAGLSDNPVDRLWVDAMAAHYADNGQIEAQPALGGESVSGIFSVFGLPAKNADLYGALKELEVKYKDPEAYAYDGWDLENVSQLNEGLSQFPNHPGLLHYKLHTLENSAHYAEAEAKVQALLAMAPNPPHYQHMYGHILPLLGRAGEANAYFLKAHCMHVAVLQLNEPLCAGMKVEAPRLTDYTPKPTELWHYSHNLELFGFSLMRSRDLEKAEYVFQERCDQLETCDSLFQFYIGEKMYQKVIDKIRDSKLPESKYAAYEGIALIGAHRSLEADIAFGNANREDSNSYFEAAIAYRMAHGSMDPKLSELLDKFIANSTAHPNFDTWSHRLPALRALYEIAAEYNAKEKAKLYDAIQKIDPGHPL